MSNVSHGSGSDPSQLGLELSLRAWADDVYIIRYKEDTRLLRSELLGQGFAVHVQEGPYSDLQLTFSPSIQRLVNHACAWRRIGASSKAAIVVEPDFVPVRNFGEQICPMPAAHGDPRIGFAWLYACGPILYGFDEYGYAHGHASSVAGYIVTPAVARHLLDFFDNEMQRERPGEYRPWDTYLGIFLRKERGVRNYIPRSHLGEHGSDSRIEHAENGARKNWHQADVLRGSLAFLPIYAKGSKLRFAKYRMRAYVWGWLRLILLRYFDPRYVNKDSSKGRLYMASFSVMRLLKL